MMKRKMSKTRSPQLGLSRRPPHEKMTTSGTPSKGGTGKHPAREAIGKRSRPLVPGDVEIDQAEADQVVVDRAPMKAPRVIVLGGKKLPRRRPKANEKIAHVVAVTPVVVNGQSVPLVK